MRQRLLAVPLLLLSFFAFASAASAAAPAYDIRGTWTLKTVHGTYSSTVTWSTENCATGAVSGSAAGGIYTLPESGTLSGTTLTTTDGPYDQLPSYTSHLSGTFDSPDHASGTFTDTGGFMTTPGDFEMLRLTGPPADGLGCGNNTVPPTPSPDGKHSSGMQVMCNYLVATSTDTCTATVGDGAAQPTSPTGSVTFTKTQGVFTLGDTCSLQSSPSAPSTASCSVQYLRPTGSTAFPAITGSYSGDATHAPATASTTFLVLAGPVQYDTPTPFKVDIKTNIDANGTSVSACGAVGGKGGSKSAVASRLLFGSVIKELKKTIKLVQTGPIVGSVAFSANASMQSALAATVGELLKTQAQIDAYPRPPSPADAKKIESLMGQIMDANRAINDARKAQGETCKQTIGQLKSIPPTASAASAKKPVRKSKSVVLGYTHVKSAKAGPLTLQLQLNKKALRKAAGKKKTVTIYLRINAVVPSGIAKKGWPESTVQKIVLTRDGQRVS